MDKKRMADYHYNPTKGNPLRKDNKLGPEFMIPEKILDKPGAITNLQQYTSKKPLAGRFGEIGERIFEVGPKKAN